MILPDPILFTKPLHVWLGMVIFIFVLLQIGTAKKILPIPFWWHRNVFWKIILGLAIIHGFYGFEIYFLK